MATIELHPAAALRQPTSASALRRLLASARRSARAVIDLPATHRRRQALRQIDGMESRMLDDIGVTRAEIDWALHLPLRVDAANALEARARARRTTTPRI